MNTKGVAIIKTVEIRKTILSELKKINNNVYFESATDKSVFPYIVYSIDKTYPKGKKDDRDDITLILDVWDNTIDTTRIENLTDTIEMHLDNLNKPTPTVLLTFYLLSRKSLKDEIETIKHRQLKFVIQSYYTGGETVLYKVEKEKFYVKGEDDG